MDIRDAFLNADITSTGIKVHTRPNRVLTDMLVQINPKHARCVEDRGTYVVVLDKALYGCVEAAALRQFNLSATMESDGFASNLYESCVFNKHGLDGAQDTVVMHDTGKAFRYDNDTDAFVVTGRVKTMSSLVVSGTTEPRLVFAHATSLTSPQWRPISAGIP